jgi:hypothetical protein
MQVFRQRPWHAACVSETGCLCRGVRDRPPSALGNHGEPGMRGLSNKLFASLLVVSYWAVRAPGRLFDNRLAIERVIHRLKIAVLSRTTLECGEK